MLKYACGLLCSVCINFINAVICICVLYDLLLSGAWLCTQFCQSVYVINFCKQGKPKTTLWLFVKCIADTPTTLEINFLCRAVRAHSRWLTFNHFSLITLLAASLFSLWLLFNMLQVSSERRTQTATALLTMTADKHFSVAHLVITSAYLTQRDRAAAVCYAYVRKVHCAVVHTVRTTGALFFSPVNFTG